LAIEQNENNFYEVMSNSDESKIEEIPEPRGFGSEILKCVICYNDVTDAHVCSNCSALFCFSCVTQWVTNFKRECPHC